MKFCKDHVYTEGVSHALLSHFHSPMEFDGICAYFHQSSCLRSPHAGLHFTCTCVHSTKYIFMLRIDFLVFYAHDHSGFLLDSELFLNTLLYLNSSIQTHAALLTCSLRYDLCMDTTYNIIFITQCNKLNVSF